MGTTLPGTAASVAAFGWGKPWGKHGENEENKGKTMGNCWGNADLLLFMGLLVGVWVEKYGDVI